MAFESRVQLLGDTQQYQLSPELKRYTLMDMNFRKKNNGSFELIQPLNSIEESTVVKAQLKIVVASDLKSFKMTVTDGKGLRKINVFKGSQYSVEKEQLSFALQNLIVRKVLAPLK